MASSQIGVNGALTEKEKMLAGMTYDVNDPELVRGRYAAKLFCQEFNKLLPPYTVHDEKIYRALIKKNLPNVAPTAWIEPPLVCDYGDNIIINGPNFYANAGCVFLDVCRITIGNNVMFGPSVHIYTASHPLDFKARREVEIGKPVTIGDDVWIGGGAIINPGVTLGSRVVVGSGSVVCRSVPDDCFVAGVPAKIKRKLTAPPQAAQAPRTSSL